MLALNNYFSLKADTGGLKSSEKKWVSEELTKTQARNQELLDIIKTSRSLVEIRSRSEPDQKVELQLEDNVGPYGVAYTSPELMLTALESAYKQGDYETVRNLLPKQERKLLDQVMVLGIDCTWAHEEFLDAMDARFGKSESRGRSDDTKFNPMSLIANDPSRHYFVLESKKLNDEKASMKVKVTRTINPETGETVTEDRQMYAYLERSGWKISENQEEQASRESTERVLKMMRQDTTAYRKITDRLKAGAFTDRKEAMSEWRKLLERPKK